MLFTFFVIILLGVIARHLLGGEFQRAWERLLGRVPVARSIYAGVKQLLEAIFTSDRSSRFNRVVMIEYPRRGVYALAFTTGPARGAMQNVIDGKMINCFLPTTPNPTSGFYLLVPEDDIIELNMSVEDAFKIVMSAGLVARTRPRASQPRRPRPRIAAPAAAGRPAHSGSRGCAPPGRGSSGGRGARGCRPTGSATSPRDPRAASQLRVVAQAPDARTHLAQDIRRRIAKRRGSSTASASIRPRSPSWPRSDPS